MEKSPVGIAFSRGSRQSGGAPAFMMKIKPGTNVRK
jgi:hypothetical protein